MSADDEIKPTWTAKQRQDRVGQLKDELKRRKEMTRSDVYKWALNTLGVSMRIIDIYMTELELTDQITVMSIITKEPVTYPSSYPEDIVVWKGGAGDD